jgi:IS605 OrfB family transposase
MRQEIDQTLQGFSDACNQILQVAHAERCYNTTKLHHLTYYTVKATTGLKANHICQAIRRVIGACQAKKKNVKEFRPTSLSLDARTFAYNEHDHVVGITLMRAKRLLKRLSGKDQKFQTWVNHNIAKQLVEEAKQLNAALAFEDLTGIRKTAKVRKSQRRNLHSWAGYQLKQFTTYKAAIAGVPVLNVPAPYTSKTHDRCLRIGQRQGKDFWCECCQVHEDADFNAANVIRLWGCVVSQPERSALLSCSLMDLITG